MPYIILVQKGYQLVIRFTKCAIIYGRGYAPSPYAVSWFAYKDNRFSSCG